MTDDAEPTVDLHPEPPSEPEPRPAARGPRTLGRDLLASGALAVVLTVLGFPFAMLWQLVTPRVEIITFEDRWASPDTFSEGYVLGDLYFAGLGLAFGIAAAVAAWAVMRRSRGPAVLLGLTVGLVASQVVAWRIGRAEWESFWDAIRDAPPGVRMWRPPSVLYVELDPGAAWQALKVGHITTALGSLQLGGLAVAALAAVFTYTVCAGWSRRPSLRSDVPE